jgi:tRNA A-37 threonylcarbamoyl transferase component Bud32
MNANPPPTQLGRYRIVKVLGRGAMGVVYEGLDPRLERPVAIKTILKGHLLDETLADEYSARFVREAQAAARLNHPNIVTVFDFGEQGDVAYLVMEFIRGQELAEAFDRGERFALPEALRIVGELLDALAYAHAQGVVHRDVKPANVMIDAGGRVKLTDFGVARLADANQDRTAPGTMVGTPSYMSPEQIQGLPVGSRADLFAAGIILYQFLTGQRPFAGGGSFAIQKQIVHDDPEPPSRRNPALPPVFDAIVARALAKSPDDRFESAASFAAALRAVPLPAPAVAPDTALATAPAPEPSEARPDPDATVVRSVAPAPAVTAPDVDRAVPAADRSERRPPRPAAAVPADAAVPVGAPRWGRRFAVGAALGAIAVVAGFLVAPRSPGPGHVVPPGVPASAAVVVAPPASIPAAVPKGDVAKPDAPKTAGPSVEATQAEASPPTLLVTKKPLPAPREQRAVARSPEGVEGRCADLRARMQLGEPLSPDGQAFFDKECKR